MTTQSFLSDLIGTLQSFESPGWYLIVCAAALLVVLLFGKRKGRVLFFYPLVLFALAALNPSVLQRVSAGQEGTGKSILSALWVIPFAMLAVCGLFSLCRKFHGKVFRVLTVVLFCAVIFLTGSPAVTEASYYYNVSMDHLTGQNEGSAIADLITQNMESDTADVYVEEEDLAAQIRAENAGLLCILEDQKKSSEKTLKNAEADFYVVETGKASDRILSSSKDLGTLIGKSRRYSIYKSK